MHLQRGDTCRQLNLTLESINSSLELKEGLMLKIKDNVTNDLFIIYFF